VHTHRDCFKWGHADSLKLVAYTAHDWAGLSSSGHQDLPKTLALVLSVTTAAGHQVLFKPITVGTPLTTTTAATIEAGVPSTTGGTTHGCTCVKGWASVDNGERGRGLMTAMHGSIKHRWCLLRL
jgi:hypothetical protein